MSTSARKRLMRDFKRLQNDSPTGISGAPQDNIMLWNAVIYGPDNTPWDGERDINPGEEITYDYHFNSKDEGQKILCYCNSKTCRQYLN